MENVFKHNALKLGENCGKLYVERSCNAGVELNWGNFKRVNPGDTLFTKKGGHAEPSIGSFMVNVIDCDQWILGLRLNG